MDKQVIVIERTYKVALEKVWEAITNKDHMKQWYFELDEFRPEVGFQFSFPGQGHKGEQYIHLCTITEIIPLKKLQYSWTYKNEPGYSLVTFELFEEGEETKLRLTHQGLETFPQDSDDFSWESFNGGWNELIGELLPAFLLKDNG